MMDDGLDGFASTTALDVSRVVFYMIWMSKCIHLQKMYLLMGLKCDNFNIIITEQISKTSNNVENVTIYRNKNNNKKCTGGILAFVFKDFALKVMVFFISHASDNH